jgi:formamidopyrimidine-DNA glycosylase
MPELPEVEYVVRSMQRLVGRRILRAKLYRERLAPNLSQRQFASRLRKASIINIHRRGKFILTELDNDQILITHLRMTGKFLLTTPNLAKNLKHIHAEFSLDDKTLLLFQDQRHFGFMDLIQKQNLGKYIPLAALSPEMLSKEFTPTFLAQSLSNRKMPIKPALMDQAVAAGIGNIYSSEALFLSKINPQKPACNLQATEVKRLVSSIRRLMTRALNSLPTPAALPPESALEPIELGSDYYRVRKDGNWRVYERKDKPCKNCRSRIKRLVQAGRSTYFCPNCQKMD